MFKGIGENLKRFRLLNGMSLKEVGDKLNITNTAVQKFEKGELIPDSDRLIEFSRLFNVNIDSIIKTYQKPVINFNNFRKRKRLSGKKLELLKDVVEVEISKYIEALELNNYNSKKVLRRQKCNSIDDAEKIAKSFRDENKISNLIPISDLTSVLENLGIVIVYIKNSGFDDFDGLSEIVNDIPVIVMIENIKDGARQRFTLAHELGHLIMEISNEEKIEIFCNRFASALLLPEEALINEVGIKRTSIRGEELEALKQKYKISYKAIIFRMKELDIISENFSKLCYIKLNKLFGKEDPNPISPEKSNKLSSMIYKLESEGIISVSKACEYLGMTIDEYRREDNPC